MSFTISVISVEQSCHMYTHLLVSARSISYIVWIVDVKTSWYKSTEETAIKLIIVLET